MSLPTELCTPELLMPSQFFCDRGALSGEKRLMMAVLEDAIACYQKYVNNHQDPQARFEYHSARIWIESMDEEWPYSFINICEALEIEHRSFRKKLIAMNAAVKKPKQRRARIAAITERLKDDATA